ncbi:MAG: tRNA nucleotidyltransferase, partial [Ignavibacteriales bacterium]|nr:tRNA nucleotidyltransferase [Ignavibacteriales bacterium]
MADRIDIDDDIVRKIGAVADSQGVEAYVVGGYVRDRLLLKEVKDTDVVVIGRGIEFAKIAAKNLGAENIVVFENFGTAMVHLSDRKIEFVGARKESYARHSRKPSVEVGSLADDLLRRDF